MGLRESNETAELRPAITWLLPAIFIVASVFIMVLGEPGREWLRYDRVWIGQGETWRFLSGHFAHLSWSHLALNGAGLILVWLLVGRAYAVWTWVSILGVILIVMDAAFWFAKPELYWYVGMSGMLHGVLLAGILARFPRFDPEALLLMLLLVAKIAWEQFSGPVPGSEVTSGGPVVVDAHLYGAIGGLLAAIITRIRVRQPASI